jgi:hypothetical protein
MGAKVSDPGRGSARILAARREQYQKTNPAIEKLKEYLKNIKF